MLAATRTFLLNIPGATSSRCEGDGKVCCKRFKFDWGRREAFAGRFNEGFYQFDLGFVGRFLRAPFGRSKRQQSPGKALLLLLVARRGNCCSALESKAGSTSQVDPVANQLCEPGLSQPPPELYLYTSSPGGSASAVCLLLHSGPGHAVEMLHGSHARHHDLASCRLARALRLSRVLQGPVQPGSAAMLLHICKRFKPRKRLPLR